MVDKAQNTITGHQLAAARVLLGLFQSEVAESANVSESTLKRFEAEKKKAVPFSNNFAEVVRVLEKCGVEFIDRGVRLRDGATPIG